MNASPVNGPVSIDTIPGLPETIITVEQWVDLHQSRFLRPEQRLYFAVLEDAIRAISKTEGHRWADRKADALAWIAGDYARILFVEACEVLEINPDWLREALQRKKDIQLERRSPVIASDSMMPNQRLSIRREKNRKINPKWRRASGSV
jgi:hypothetical protein